MDKGNADRFKSLREINKRVCSQNKEGNLQLYKESVLLADEILVASLDVVAFKGFVGHRLDLKVGSGLILVTKLCDGSHRLHFYVDDIESSFAASQSFTSLSSTSMSDNATRSEAKFANSTSAKQKIEAKRTLTGTFRTCFVEDNLVHVHSEVEEVSNYVSLLYASSSRRERMSKDKFKLCKSCCSKCKCPCSLCACLTCTCCCPKCPKCPKCCPEEFDCKPDAFSSTYEIWESDAQSERDKEIKLDRLLMQPWEKQQDGLDVQFPFQKMDRAIPNGQNEEAGSFNMSIYSLPTLERFFYSFYHILFLFFVLD